VARRNRIAFLTEQFNFSAPTQPQGSQFRHTGITNF
jgi:hypothetical protein